MSILSKPYFHDEAAAFRHLESILWANGPVCPHCGVVSENHYDLGKTRLGLRKCCEKACRKQFTVKVGTVFEHARMPLNKMLQAVHLMASSKKGISAHQLHRVLEVTYKTAWFLSHRIREAMRDGSLAPLGGAGGVVEIDETYIGRLSDVPKQVSGSAHKNIVLTLVERGGSARSFHIGATTLNEITKIVRENVQRDTIINTDEGRWYLQLGKHFLSHDAINHSRKEYARGDITTNTVEGFYSIFKRGMKGVYQHCGEKHLHRYLAEFDFRYSNRIALGVDDQDRAARALKGMVGKRLTYRWPDSGDRTQTTN